jgi:hypothetical protein
MTLTNYDGIASEAGNANSGITGGLLRTASTSSTNL